MSKPVNVISLSGGKDSTAMAILSKEREGEMKYVFADTGHEHPATYDYIEYLRSALDISIDVVKSDFTAQIARKRIVVETKWRKEGVDEKIIDNALSVLHPTGIPYLDLCLWKGRFPSTQAQFCTQELKSAPLHEYLDDLIDRPAVISWQGIRSDESRRRSTLEMYDVEVGSWEPKPSGMLIYRPIINWTVEDVFAKHTEAGIEPNPLYKKGMGRVGCMPCINARKGELRGIAQHFPEVIDRVREWERLVGLASKRGRASFFSDDSVRGMGIDEHAEWSKTVQGGRKYDLIHAIELTDPPPVCTSIYGLCE